MFGYLIPRSYKEALEFDKESNNTKWADATRDEMDRIKEQEVFTTCQRAKWNSSHKENMKMKCYEYIPTYVDDLCIAAQDP